MAASGLNELNAVVAIAARKSFRAAAVELGISPSALSHAVTALEKRIGVRLFNRSTRSVALSAAGEAFLARVRPALRDIAEAMEQVNAFRDSPRGQLRLNMSEGAAQILQPAMFEFLRRYPEMQLDVVSEGRFVDIVAGGFDAGVRLLDSVPQDMVAVPFGGPFRMAVVGSPDFFVRHRRPQVPADLLDLPCLRSRLPSGTVYRWEFARRGEEIALDVQGPLTLDSHPLMLEAARQGLALAFVGEWGTRDDLATGRLERVLDDWTPLYPGLCLYYSGHRLVPAGLKAFISVLREILPAA
jgi:DNA-binding transcriptional LysR family regulator